MDYTLTKQTGRVVKGGGGKRGGQLRVDQAERFFRTLGQIPQDGQFFEMTDDNGKRGVYQLIEFRGDNDFPYRNDRKRFIRSEPWIEYTDSGGNYHSASVIDIYKRDIVSLGGTPTMLLNPGDCFCEVSRNKGGEIISIVSSCYMCTEWRRGYIDGIEQRYMDMIEWHGYTECRRIDKYSKDVFTEKKLSDGFMSGRYVKVDAAYGGVHCKVMMYQHITDFFKAENERKVNNK